MKEKDLYFSFEFVDELKISKEINKLDEKKACQEHDIPVKLIKLNKDLSSHFIYHNFNNSLFSSNFPSTLNAADILPTQKKKGKSDIENYRPISFLSTLSKIYERCMYEQIYEYFDQILSKYQCARKARSSVKKRIESKVPEKSTQEIDSQNIVEISTEGEVETVTPADSLSDETININIENNEKPEINQYWEISDGKDSLYTYVVETDPFMV